jgi:hypothetical protein
MEPRSKRQVVRDLAEADRGAGASHGFEIGREQHGARQQFAAALVTSDESWPIPKRDVRSEGGAVAARNAERVKLGAQARADELCRYETVKQGLGVDRAHDSRGAEFGAGAGYDSDDASRLVQHCSHRVASAQQPSAGLEFTH